MDQWATFRADFKITRPVEASASAGAAGSEPSQRLAAAAASAVGSGGVRPPTAPVLPAGKKYHFFICHHQGSGGDQANNLHLLLTKRGYNVWYDNGQAANHRNLQGMRKGVEESVCLLIFLSGRTETDGHPDPSGLYEGPFTRWFCHEEMHTAHLSGLKFVGVKENDSRHGKPDFVQEKTRAMKGKDGGPVSEHAAANLHLLDDVCFIDFERQEHLVAAMLDEIERQFAEDQPQVEVLKC